MSSFDDEFGLFSETVVDEPEPLDSTRVSRKEAPSSPPSESQQIDSGRGKPGRGVQGRRPSRPPVRRERRPSASSSDPWAGHRRATELLEFLARKLVQKPESVTVELVLVITLL